MAQQTNPSTILENFIVRTEGLAQDESITILKKIEDLMIKFQEEQNVQISGSISAVRQKTHPVTRDSTILLDPGILEILKLNSLEHEAVVEVLEHGESGVTIHITRIKKG